MDIKEFGKVMIREVKDMLGEGYYVTFRDVEKNNGIIHHALMIRKDNNNIAPTIYIDDMHRQYEEGAMLMRLAKNVVELYKHSQPATSADVSFFMDFSMVSEKLFFKVVNYDKNKKKLKDVPIKRALDLALVPLCKFESTNMGNGTITIQKSHLANWEISEEELWENVVESAVKIEPVKVSGLVEMMEKMLGQQLCDSELCGMYVVTNKSQINGAGVIFYPEVLRDLADYHESDLFVIPASVHETIIIPVANTQIDVGSLGRMICEVNRSAVGEEEILSDNLYIYERESDKLCISMAKCF